MKYLFVIICSFFCFWAFSQSEQMVQPKRLSYGLSFSPTINYRTLTSSAPNDLVKEIRNDDEVADLGNRTGLNLEFRISDNWDIQSGLILSNRGFKTQKQQLLWADENISGPTKAFISQQYLYLDIPLKLKYNFFPREKINWFVSGGINTALFFLYKSKNHVEAGGNWEIAQNTSFNLNSINFLAEIETGFEYKFNAKIKFRTSVNFIHGILPTNVNLRTKEYLYSGGVNLGFIFTPHKKSKRK